MKRRSLASVSWAPLLGLSSLLTHCALTDHFQLGSDTGGVGSNLAGADSGGSSATSSNGGLDLGAAGETPTAGNATGGASAAGASESGGATAQAGGAGMSTEIPCATTCTAAETCCGGVCANLDTAQKNCGACGMACNEGRMCTAGVCHVGWVAMSPPPSGFVPRTKAASCAMGSDVFIWGGSDVNNLAIDTGAIYSPSTDMWTPVSKGAGMPSPRTFASAVWTGSVVIVYGGTDNGKIQMPLNSGSIYDPKTGVWTALPNAPSARSQPVGYWDGSRAIFWGGNNGPQNIGVAGVDRFNLTSWSGASGMNDPGPLLVPAYAFDGSALYLQGGQLNNMRQDRVYSYTPSADKWATLSKSLTARSSAFGVWDGSHFVVFGGNDGSALHNDGKYLTGTTWTTMNTTSAPSARLQAVRRSGWAFQLKPGVSVILGGQISLQNTALLSSNGATYDSGTNQWTALADWPSGEDHEYGVGVWTGQEFVLWSGHNGVTLTGTGERLAF